MEARIDSVVDAVQYGYPRQNIEGIQATLKEFAKFACDKGYMVSASELKEEFQEMNTFRKVGAIITSPFSAIVMAGGAGIAAVKYIYTLAKAPKFLNFLRANGVTEERLQEISSLQEHQIGSELANNGNFEYNVEEDTLKGRSI